MVTLANHGGFCCGARHLYNFDTIVNGSARGTAQEQILTALREAAVGRRIEVILNERQVTSTRGREILDTLARLGFVLAEQYLNHNHNPPRKNFVFTRCDTRRRTDERLPFTWSGQWLTPNLTGSLPAIPRTTAVGYAGPLPTERIDVTGIVFGRTVDPALPIVFEDGTPARVTEISTVGDTFRVRAVDGIERGTVEGRRAQSGAWYTMRSGGYGGEEWTYQRVANFTPPPVLAVGATIGVTRPESPYWGHTGTVTRLTDANVYVRVGGMTRSFLRTSVRVVTPAAPAAPPAPLVIEPQRHEQGTPPVVANRAPPPPVEVPARVVYTTFHNRYQDGRFGAGYDSLAACEAAAPRCRTRIQRNIWSDGRVEDVNL